MIMEIKYTTDGKKVVVIGDLNQTEKIVQEIFVTKSGDEIPTGERFIVKSLLDEPAKSWKEKELEKLEARYDNEKREWESKLNRIVREKQVAYDSLSARVKWLKNVAKEPHQEKLKNAISTLAEFFTNNDKWVFYEDYSTWHLEKFNENGVNRIFDHIERDYGRERFDSMRLLSLYGKSDGDVEWRVSTYYDGSGSDTTVHFFKSEKDATSFIKRKFEKIEEYGSRHFDIAKKFGLKLDENKVDAFNAKKRERLNKSLEIKRKELSDLENELSELNK